MKDEKLPHESCSLCRDIPDSQHQDGMKEIVHIPWAMETFSGWEGENLNSGYKKFNVTCPECKTTYLVEVDVESLVWDLDVTRLAGTYKNYKGSYG